MVAAEAEEAEVLVGVGRVVVDLLALGLDPAAVVGPHHALVLVLPPVRRHHVVLLQEVTCLVHQRRVPAAGQHKPLPLPVVPAVVN